MWGYLAVLLLGAIGGFWITEKLDDGRYTRLQTTYQSYQAQVKADAAKTLQDQTEEKLAKEKEYAAVVTDLTQKLADAATHADNDQRIIASLLASRSTSPDRDPVRHSSASAATESAGGNLSLATMASLCADVAAEDERNGLRLNALIGIQ